MPYPGVNPWELTFNSRKRRSRDLVDIINPGKGFAPSAKINELLAAEESERAKRLYGVDIAPEDTSIFVYNTVELQKNPPPVPIPNNLKNTFALKTPLPPKSVSITSKTTSSSLTEAEGRKIIQSTIEQMIKIGASGVSARLTQYRDAGLGFVNGRTIPADFV